MPFDVTAIRKQFPALSEQFGETPAIFFDGPGGTQVPQSVIDAMTDYLTRRNANTHGPFETSRRTDAVIDHAHQTLAAFLNADADEVIFGQNMTSLTYAMSRSLANEVHRGDEILVTHLDHDANVAPWLQLAEDRGATVRWADVDLENCTLDMEHLKSLINEKTKIVAVGYASNATGAINDVATVAKWAREAGALSYIDAVHYAPHGLIDVKALDCDFLVCSPYKFFGPHAGVLFGKRAHLERLRSYQVRPAGPKPPKKWETGTGNFEAQAASAAAVEYIASIGVSQGDAAEGDTLRTKLNAAYAVIHAYETGLKEKLITGLEALPGVRIYGITERAEWEKRVTTVSIRKEGVTPLALAEALGKENIFVWEGNFYALSISQRLGVEESGGLVRIGLVHYNTAEEVDRLLAAIDGVSG